MYVSLAPYKNNYSSKEENLYNEKYLFNYNTVVVRHVSYGQ